MDLITMLSFSINIIGQILQRYKCYNDINADKKVHFNYSFIFFCDYKDNTHVHHTHTSMLPITRLQYLNAIHK